MNKRIPSTLITLGVLLIFVFPIMSVIAFDSANNDEVIKGSFVQNEILIALEPEYIRNLEADLLNPYQTGISTLSELNQQYNVDHMIPVFIEISPTDSLAQIYGLRGIFKLIVPAGTDILTMIEDYSAIPVIKYAEVNRIYRAIDIPNDSNFSSQWALNNTGQTGGTPDADIDAVEAWDIEQGDEEILIAIVDTGINYNHPDLSAGRIRTDIDKDFVNIDDDAMDDQGHGTFVAGIAGADTNNDLGMAGVCRNCQIVPIKVLDSSGSGTSEQVAQGVQYAGQIGADVISMSLGYPSNCGCSQTVATAINYAFDSGSFLVAASGNDSDKTQISYPFSSPRVMSVGATDHNDQEASFSNRSPGLDILAPGVDIYSLDLNSGYRTADGTSAATPHVAGVAGLILSAKPTLQNTQLWWALYHSADTIAGLGSELPMASTSSYLQDIDTYKVYLPLIMNMRLRTSSGRLNAYNALTLPYIGSVSVDIDDCTGEPSCLPGCGAEVVLAGDVSVLESLDLLYNFRDNVLTRSSLGNKWIDVYYENRFEVALILATDTELRNQTRLALNHWIPLIIVLVNEGDRYSGDYILTEEHVESLSNVIHEFTLRGSMKLNRDLYNFWEESSFSEYVGWDIRDAWEKITK